MTAYVHIVMQYEDNGMSEIVGVFSNAALAKRVAARRPRCSVYTAPMNKELGKAKV